MDITTLVAIEGLSIIIALIALQIRRLANTLDKFYEKRYGVKPEDEDDDTA